jgi:hypothetical protein
MWNGLTTKHPGYRSERETRLVMIGVKGEYDAIEQRNDRGTPFVAYRFNRSKVVRKIILGPDSADGAVHAVKEYLTGIGLPHVSVVRSTLPYRSLETVRITNDEVKKALG